MTLFTSRAARSRGGCSARSPNEPTFGTTTQTTHNAHGSGNSPNGTERDAVLGFSLLELLDGLSRCPHFLADLSLAKAEGLAHRSDPSAGGTRREAPREFEVSVELGES